MIMLLLMTKNNIEDYDSNKDNNNHLLPNCFLTDKNKKNKNTSKLV